MGNLQSGPVALAWPGGSLPSSADSEAKLLERISRKSAKATTSLCLAQGSNLPLVAAARGYARVLNELGQQGGDPHAFTQVRDSKQRTPLHLAAKAGQANAVAILIDQELLGADLYAVDKRGNTALHLAAAGVTDGHIECVSLLLSASKAREAQQPQQQQQAPVRGGARRSSRRHLVDMQNSEGLTALHLAAATGNLDSVQLLLSAGADLCLMTFKQARGWPWLHQVPARSTALHLAAASGHLMVSKAIVQAYLDIPRDVRKPDPRLLHDIEGHVPYMVAGNNGHWLVAQLLLLISADNTHQYWHQYMNLNGDQVMKGETVPSLASIAQGVWLNTLEQQLMKVAAAASGGGAPPQQQHALALPSVPSAKLFMQRSGTYGSACMSVPAPGDTGANGLCSSGMEGEGSLQRRHTQAGSAAAETETEARIKEVDEHASPTALLPAPTAEPATQPSQHVPPQKPLQLSRAPSSCGGVPVAQKLQQQQPAQQGSRAARATEPCERTPFQQHNFWPAEGSAAHMERTHSLMSAASLSTRCSEEATGKGRTCEVCFERPAACEMLLCGHTLCASCSKRVVRLEEARKNTAPKCPFCQQFILGFAPRNTVQQLQLGQQQL